MEYGFDFIDGRQIPQLVVTDDYIILGKHQGTVHVEGGTLTIQGKLNGSLDVKDGAKVIIIGEQNGSVHVDCGAEILVHGRLNGSITISSRSTVIVEKGGRLAGSLTNNGQLIVRGIFGGPQSGNGKIILEGNGYIKQPVIKNGMTFY